MNFRGKALVTVAAVSLGLAGSGAACADTGNNPPEQVYAGPVLGYDNVVLSDVGYSVNRGGLTYGGLVGIDSPVGEHGRVGLEAKVTGSTAAYTFAAGGDELKLAAGVDMYVGAKLGWMIQPRVQLFTTLGYAFSRFTGSVKEDGIKVAQDSMNKSGFRAGVGGEYFLSKQVRARLEYDYTHYGELKLDGYSTGVKMERHQVTAGLLYGF